MQSGETVVLQENDGRDMCCVISSLIQIILDPHYRTLIGFQTLIQKEWVALGHPFRYVCYISICNLNSRD